MAETVTAKVFDIGARVSGVLGIPVKSVNSVLDLNAEGSTVPFIARYRKEATGGLDEVQVRKILELGAEVEELEKRRGAILSSLEERGLLTAELKAAVNSAETKTRLEDLYLPYRPKRRTRASIAIEKGLKPLADRISAQPSSGNPAVEAAAFVDVEKGVEDVDAALAGARDIVAEIVSDNADIRAMVRRAFLDYGLVVSAVTTKSKASGEPTPYEQYYSFSQGVAAIPSHRFLAIRRGTNEGVLKMSVSVDDDAIIARILKMAGHRPTSPFSDQFHMMAVDSYKRLISPAVETEVFGLLGEFCEKEASGIFAQNLRNVLMAPPYGPQAVVGIDPGIRTGCKCAAVAATGAYVESTVIFPDRRPEESAAVLVKMVKKVSAKAVSVGNGTFGRESESFARKALADAGLPSVLVVPVSESGASVYSASDVARLEFPDLDLTVRGAISIGRRLQDPLAELVKVEPKSIGVGQYQHDITASLLDKRLDEVVEDCVNSVGVDLNTASAPLLSRVAGIGAAIAKSIVDYREKNGAFTDRRQLLKVPKLGPKAYQQCAGFLRVNGGKNPLDASAVHPERYDLVDAMAKDVGVKVSALVGNPELVKNITLTRYVAGDVGMPTLTDIVAELGKPGRDPREGFEAPAFRDDVHQIEDLVPGMELEGIVTNVVAFGAFVDIGVHQDGLVHISELADKYVKDPSSVVRTGMKVKVRVVEIDTRRRRIALSMKGL
jgi:uncharacterized protein